MEKGLAETALVREESALDMSAGAAKPCLGGMLGDRGLLLAACRSTLNSSRAGPPEPGPFRLRLLRTSDCLSHSWGAKSGGLADADAPPAALLLNELGSGCMTDKLLSPGDGDCGVCCCCCGDSTACDNRVVRAHE